MPFLVLCQPLSHERLLFALCGKVWNADLSLDCLVHHGAVLLGVLLLIHDRLVLGLMVGRGGQRRRVVVHGRVGGLGVAIGRGRGRVAVAPTAAVRMGSVVGCAVGSVVAVAVCVQIG
jgi:hypothetical protein